MAALPGLPFKVAMGVYSWAENHMDSINYPVLKELGCKALEFCRNNPVIGGCALLTTVLSLGPITVLLGFLVFANSCLLLGVAALESLMIAMTISVFIPILFVIGTLSFAITTCLAVLHYILFGRKPNTVKKRGDSKERADIAFLGKNTSCHHRNKDDFDNKMTQTIEWVEKTGQAVQKMEARLANRLPNRIEDNIITRTVINSA